MRKKLDLTNFHIEQVRILDLNRMASRSSYTPRVLKLTTTSFKGKENTRIGLDGLLQILAWSGAGKRYAGLYQRKRVRSPESDHEIHTMQRGAPLTELVLLQSEISQEYCLWKQYRTTTKQEFKRVLEWGEAWRSFQRTSWFKERRSVYAAEDPDNPFLETAEERKELSDHFINRFLYTRPFR
jgi:hypothetical protein